MNTAKIEIEIRGYTQEEVDRFREIFHALITTGGLSGVKGGRTILHFDQDGIFQGIELDYWPWKRRKQNSLSTARN